MASQSQTEMIAEVRKVQSHYRSGSTDLGKDFFSVCFKYCSAYRRAAGFFSSSALISWSSMLPRIIQPEDVFIKLIISPKISPQDICALELATSETEREGLLHLVIDKLIIELLATSEDSEESIKMRVKLLAWMIANSKLLLRFAFPEHVSEPGMFHEKMGIFDFPWGDRVAFTGSANETFFGHSRNYESIDIYRSWVPQDEERVEIKIGQFDEAWAGGATGLKVLPLSHTSLERIKTYAPEAKPTLTVKGGYRPNKWRHQDEAAAKFLEVRHGILEMATGTGKTRTALKILEALTRSGKIDGAIVSTTGTDLLDQWSIELDRWTLDQKNNFRVLRHYESNHDLGEFALHPGGAILVISREQLSKLFSRLPAEARATLMIVHDEVHGLGSPQSTRDLIGQHESFGYRLGLSATPEREYDEEGTSFISSEIGEVIFCFGLEDAIERGILCEFNYVPIFYELTENDRDRIKKVYLMKSAREREGRPMSEEELWMEIARVYKTAEQKPSLFFEYLRTNPTIIKSTTIFIEERSYGTPILEELHQHTHLYRTYYAEDDRANLNDFAKGRIDCLITCHRISQGIDIKHLRNVILFSSARAKLETIQRIGRCLRIDPNRPEKKANIVDFVLRSEGGSTNADGERYDWLLKVSQTKRKE